MPPEDIDNLFRDALAGHPTPPGEALWARLQANTAANGPDADAERLDTLFQQGLQAHATPPGRELWERLEDEHLRPKKHRAPAWWPLALVAALALLVVAGGASLWLGSPLRNTSGGTVASQQRGSNNATKAKQPANRSSSNTPVAARRATVAATTISDAAAFHPATAASAQKNTATQATRSATFASTAPKPTTAHQQSLHHLTRANRQPDAATDHLSLVTRTTARATPHSAFSQATAADEQRPPVKTSPVLASVPDAAPEREVPSAGAAPAPSLASAGGLITVDVRSGGDPEAAQPTKATVAAVATEHLEDHRRLGGRLLQQAGHLVRGERLSLAEVTGLPENVTLRATIGGRQVTKSIQF